MLGTMDAPKYASPLHRVLQEWIDSHQTTWLWLTQQAGISPSRGTDVKRGARIGMETLHKLAAVMEGVSYEDLAVAAGYIERSSEGIEIVSLEDEDELMFHIPKGDIPEEDVEEIKKFIEWVKERRRQKREGASNE